MYDKCGMARNASGLKEALAEIPKIREEFWSDVQILGSGSELNQMLERAGRVADFLELAELMCIDALARDESCGSHFREEHVDAEGEAKRNDQDFAYVAAWEHTGDHSAPKLHKEKLEFEYVKLSQRSYK
jgi:succinate dehydrogenase / fumarate reductase flavoprotein subunit